MTLMVALPLNAPPSHYRHVWLRVLVCRDVTSDLIIGLLSIQFYDLLPLLNTHPATSVCCEICAIRTHNTTRSARRTGTVTLGPTGENNHDDDTVISGRSFPQDGPLPILLPHHHSTYTEPMATMVATDSCGSWYCLSAYIHRPSAVGGSHAWFAYVWDVRVRLRWADEEGSMIWIHHWWQQMHPMKTLNWEGHLHYSEPSYNSMATYLATLWKAKSWLFPRLSLQSTSKCGKQTRIGRRRGIFPQRNMTLWTYCLTIY